MQAIPVEDFDLSCTIESGQIFRYVRLDDGYLVHQRNRVFKLSQKGRVLFFEGADERFLVHYLALDEDYGRILATLRRDGTLKEALDLYQGLRILRQDPWECLVSFLCSSCKSIVQIRVILERLCRAFGEPVALGSYQGYAFPDEGRIGDVKRLRNIGLGFRARYVDQVNRFVDPEHLQGLVDKPYEEARVGLMKLPGVGEKIADCVLLFSMGFHEAFPVDTWVKRGMERRYFQGREVPPSRIGAYARQRFGPFAGYAQQFLYHFWRRAGRR